MSAPEQIWLQAAEDAEHQCEGRLWCKDKVWPENDEQHEPTEFVRADIAASQLAEITEKFEIERGLNLPVGELQEENETLRKELAEAQAERDRLMQEEACHDEELFGWEQDFNQERKLRITAEAERDEAIKERDHARNMRGLDNSRQGALTAERDEANKQVDGWAKAFVELTEERDRLAADNARKDAALRAIKARACGDRAPNWNSDTEVTRSRSWISDTADTALAGEQ